MRVLRHQIGITDYQVIGPPNGELLSVALSRTLPNIAIDLWSIDDESGRSGLVAIYVVGTGNSMPDDLIAETDSAGNRWRHFIGTVVTPNGLVWHVFEGPVR